MSREWVFLIAIWILYFLLGLLLGSVGLSISNPVYWTIVLIVMAIDLISGFRKSDKQK